MVSASKYGRMIAGDVESLSLLPSLLPLLLPLLLLPLLLPLLLLLPPLLSIHFEGEAISAALQAVGAARRRGDSLAWATEMGQHVVVV